MSRRAKPLGSSAASAPMSLAEIIRIVHALIEADDTVSGATVVMPNGKKRYIDAATLRQGGAA
jgi:phage-related protein